ncbi:COMPASS (complex proteins associated with Set1p) component [Arachnomyces sp. PD_36]|nr:COMPASS (complex proteins associated with Set1p) component [Arachnomyces sp. PD_36]
MSDERLKPPFPVPSHPNLGPSPGGEAQSAESLPTPQQLPEAPHRQAQSSIMQDTNSAVNPAVLPSKRPQPPSIQEPNRPPPIPTTYATMDPNNPDVRPQDIIMTGGGAAAEQQHQQPQTAHLPPTTTTATGPTPKVRAGGAPARVFMNENIVPYLLEGMKNVTRDQFSLPIPKFSIT